MPNTPRMPGLNLDNAVPQNQPAFSHSVPMDYQNYNNMIQMLNGQQPRAPPPVSGLGNPGPLGLAGFAATTFVLSCFNAGVLIDGRLESSVLPLALFYGGIAQFIAGLYEFRSNNTFGATAFCSYGAFWASFAGYVYFIVPTIATGEVGYKENEATGLFLLVWTIFTFYMTIASWRVSWALFAVFFPLTITFILLTAGAFANNKHTTEVGGWCGIVTAFAAWYASAAVVINNSWGRAVFPIGVRQPLPPKDH